MLHLIEGSDDYQIRTAIDTHLRQLQAAHGAPLEVLRIDCTDELAVDRLHHALKYTSFFDEPRVIIATNAAIATLQDLWSSYDVGKLRDIHVIASHRTDLKGGDKKTLAQLHKHATSQIVVQPHTGAQLITWAQQYCVAASRQLSDDAARHLISRVGSSMTLLAIELEKLIAAAASCDISATLIDQLTTAHTEPDVWELSNAIAAYDKRRIVVALWKSLQEGTSAFMLLGSLSAGLRNLVMIEDLLARGTPSARIASITGLHPFVVTKALVGARKAHRTQLHQALKNIARIDQEAKRGDADITDALFATVLALS